MKKIYSEDSNKNARININYSGIKPKVKISYPSKKYQSNESMAFYILLMWVMLSMIIGGIVKTSDMLEDIRQKENTHVNGLLTCALDVRNDILNYKEIKETVCNDEYEAAKNLESSFSIKSILITLAWTFVPWIFIYLPFKKKWDRLYPKFQALISRKKFTKLKAKDLDYTEKRGWYCEVPVFGNVLFDYKATEDFSKYLTWLEIREHKFKYYNKPRSKKKAIKKGPLEEWRNYMAKKRNKGIKRNRKRFQLNQYLWYARFYFNKKPEKGFIEVLYK